MLGTCPQKMLSSRLQIVFFCTMCEPCDCDFSPRFLASAKTKSLHKVFIFSSCHILCLSPRCAHSIHPDYFFFSLAVFHVQREIERTAIMNWIAVIGSPSVAKKKYIYIYRYPREIFYGVEAPLLYADTGIGELGKLEVKMAYTGYVTSHLENLNSHLLKKKLL